mgnify:CR=1 FL=1|tara:strand:+ start:7407 stop:8063 length:657 start_codon:yes stop_codon:yes gene_type:complete
MPYYPLSQIKTNLQTDGTEYQTSDGTPYVGFYYKVSNGKLYTGKSPQAGENRELSIQQINQFPTDLSPNINPKNQIIPAFPDGDPDPTINPIYQETSHIYNEYNNLVKHPATVFTPYFNPTYPTEQDYNIGEFRRYFVKRSNNIIYLEIDKPQYDLIINKNPSIMWSMYIPFTLPWNISGDKNQVATINKNLVELTSFRRKLPKLGDYLKHNYIKYYK